nr:MAG TPA: Glutaredoxin [Caudoviricetes sp.]
MARQGGATTKHPQWGYLLCPYCTTTKEVLQ